MWWQLLQPVASQCRLLEWVGVFSLQPLGQECCESKKKNKPASGVQGLVRQVRGSLLAAGAGMEVTANVYLSV